MRGSEQRRGRPRAGDHDRHEQRQPEQRAQQVSSPCADRERRHERAYGRDAEVAEHQHPDQVRQRLADGGAEQQQSEGGNRHELEHDEVGEQRERLGEQQRRAVHRREQEPVEAALLALGHEQPVDAQHGREQQRHPEDPGGQGDHEGVLARQGPQDGDEGGRRQIARGVTPQGPGVAVQADRGKR